MGQHVDSFFAGRVKFLKPLFPELALSPRFRSPSASFRPQANYRLGISLNNRHQNDSHMHKGIQGVWHPCTTMQHQISTSENWSNNVAKLHAFPSV
jgi:hypothetical protein